MGNYTKCAWCGCMIEKNAWNKFVSHNTMGIGGKQKDSYCSKKCQTEAEGSNSTNSGNSNSGKTPDMSAENNAELARIQWEREKAAKQEKDEKDAKYEAETAEKKAKRKAKALILKEQGKPFMALIAIHSENIGYASIFILAYGGMAFLIPGMVPLTVKIISGIVIGGIYGFGIYKYFKENSKK